MTRSSTLQTSESTTSVTRAGSVDDDREISDLAVTLEGHVATITIRRPPDNFVDVDLARSMADVVLELDADVSCRAIVLAAEGKHFCAGARLSPDAGDYAYEGGNPLYQQVARLMDGSVPIIAAVQGAAIGAGLGPALIADFRVACAEARFSAAFVRLGLHPGFGTTVTLPRVVGSQRAMELLYTGRRITGEEALAIGLCDRLTERADVLATTRALALEIAGSAPLAVRATRRTLRGALADAVRTATDVEHAAQQEFRRSDDYREGVTAGAELRPPDFKGR